ncbi:MAG: ABC-2 transporter permease [Acetanaerobacterium sp.]
MMMLHLVKKDFLLVKKYVLFMLLFTLAFPLFILWRAPVFIGFVSFLFTAFFTEFILCQAVSLLAAKYPKTDALLCAAPYSRSCIVKAKYACFLLIFVLCCLVYSIVSLVIPAIGVLNVSTVLLVLLLCAIPYSIYMPFQFKLGFEKTKFAFMIIIFGLSFGTPLIYMANVQLDLSILSAMSALIQCVALAAATIAALGISMRISIGIYAKKEL